MRKKSAEEKQKQWSHIMLGELLSSNTFGCGRSYNERAIFFFVPFFAFDFAPVCHGAATDLGHTR